VTRGFLLKRRNERGAEIFLSGGKGHIVHIDYYW